MNILTFFFSDKKHLKAANNESQSEESPLPVSGKSSEPVGSVSVNSAMTIEQNSEEKKSSNLLIKVLQDMQLYQPTMSLNDRVLKWKQFGEECMV